MTSNTNSASSTSAASPVSSSGITTVDKETIRILNKQGEFFGYPKCCVKSFVKYVTGKGKRTRIQSSTAHPEGFVPCEPHAKRIHRGEINVKEIIQNRVCTVGFVFENYKGEYFTEVKKSEEFKEWLKMVRESNK